MENNKQSRQACEENELYRTFINITQEEIRKNGPSSFLPTIVFPETRTIKVIEGIPNGADQESEVKKWVAKSSPGGLEYFLAYKKSVNGVLIEWLRNGSIVDVRIIEVHAFEQ